MSTKKRVGAGHMGDDSAREGKINTPSGEKCCVCSSSENVRRCGNCKMVSYCSKKCQKSHWKDHAVYCSAIVDLVKCEKEKIYGNHTVRQNQMDFKTKRKMMKLVGDKPMLNCQLGGRSFEMLWDTGSMISLVDRRWVNENFPDEKIHSVTEFMEDELNVRAANATSISFDGVVLVEFGLKDGGERFMVPLLVASDDIAGPILGYK